MPPPQTATPLEIFFFLGFLVVLATGSSPISLALSLPLLSSWYSRSQPLKRMEELLMLMLVWAEVASYKH